MTGTPEHGREPAGDWLVDDHRTVLDGLGQFTDLDAGLQEVTTLQAGHGRLVAALHGSLDTEAGLADILPPPATAPPAAPQPPGTAAAAAIAAADPAVRIALRRNPVILAVILSNLTVRALTIAGEIPATNAFPLRLARTRDLAFDLARARDLAFELAFDLDVARDLARDLDRASAGARDLARALDLDVARDLDRASARDRARALARARDLARDRARDLARVLILVLARDRDLDLTRDLARDRAIALDLAYDLDLDLAYGLDLARDLDHRTALLVGSALGTRQIEGLAAALLEGALNDFTRADLTNAGLAESDLPGVRWSEQDTKWPPGTNLDRLRALSRKVAPDIYVITRRPDDSNKPLHHALS